jgi:uncharacterized protein
LPSVFWGIFGDKVTSVKLPQIPKDGVLAEKGLTLGLGELGLEAPFAGAILLDYEFRNLYGKILGSFSVRGTMTLECSRCLSGFDQAAHSKFIIEFEERPEDGNPRNLPSPEDPGLNVVFFSGEEITFADEIRQEMELLVPFAALCREDCKGLCPECGADLNDKHCGCELKPTNHPFEGLNKLFQQHEEN